MKSTDRGRRDRRATTAHRAITGIDAAATRTDHRATAGAAQRLGISRVDTASLGGRTRWWGTSGEEPGSWVACGCQRLERIVCAAAPRGGVVGRRSAGSPSVVTMRRARDAGPTCLRRDDVDHDTGRVSKEPSTTFCHETSSSRSSRSSAIATRAMSPVPRRGRRVTVTAQVVRPSTRRRLDAARRAFDVALAPEVLD